MSDKIKFGKRTGKRKKEKKTNPKDMTVQTGESSIVESHYNTIASICGGSAALDAALRA